jgi:hypothetical protein
MYCLHCSSSHEDVIVHYEEVMPRWRSTVPDFANYFEEQWNNGDEFTNWKIFCSEPDVASTNIALESFNKTIRKVTHLGSITAFQHCLTLSWIGLWWIYLLT